MQKVIAVFLIGFLLTACGSVSTLPRSEEAIKNSLLKHNTKCSYIPYVYSGVTYDFCWLSVEYDGSAGYPENSEIEPPDNENVEYPEREDDGRGFAALVALDFVLSGVIDTIALPYTWYKQSKYGSISLEER